MTNVVDLKPDEGFPVDYITSDDGKVIGVSHPKWPYSIMRKEDEIALVTEDGEPFGILNADQFNTILMCWLLIDAPELVDN